MVIKINNFRRCLLDVIYSTCCSKAFEFGTFHIFKVDLNTPLGRHFLSKLQMIQRRTYRVKECYIHSVCKNMVNVV